MTSRPILLLLAAIVLGAVLSPAPAQAALLDTSPAVACDNASRLASVVQSEAYSQPIAAQVAIAQIVTAEARSRGMSVCQLTALTHFVSVYRYAQAHPLSWHMRQMTNPQPWALDIAEAALAGQGADMRGGAMHFDGAPCGDVLWTAGETWFCE